MDNFNFNVVNDRQPQTAAVSKTFISSVFSWMAAALAITAIVAYQFGANPDYMSILRNPAGGSSILGFIIMLAPLGFIMIISGGFQKFSYPTLLSLFLAFSVVMGMSLSYIFLRYTASSIYQTFGVASAMFGLMALVGYTTKTDLTKLGSLLFMGLIGIILASVVNMFMHSGGLQYIISFLGVIIFTGLTAYDVQKLKEIGSQVEEGSQTASKIVIMGALTLYLDFINIFLFLLELFGGRRRR